MGDPRGDNPFVAFGTIATGDRFVGRGLETARLEERVLRGAGSTAVVGIARIGKSSLAAEVVRRTAVNDNPTLWLDLSTFESAVAFFDEWASQLLGDSLAESTSTHAAFRRLNRMLVSRATQGVARSLIVIDEFDAVRGWKDGGDFMRLLRELLYDPSRTGVVAILCSRREIARLELETQDVSTLDGVLDHISLGPMSAAEIDSMYARIEVPVHPEVRATVQSVAGEHPYLVEMCLASVSTSGDIAALASSLGESASRYLESLLKFLTNERLLLEAVQAVVGPRVSNDRSASMQLKRYGLLIDSRRTFSCLFEETLALASLDADLWGLFGEVEKQLRVMIDVTLSAVYGLGWLDVVAGRHRSVSTLVEQARGLRDSDAAKFPAADSESLLRYTYPAQLRDLIQAEWQHFKPILGRDLTHWRPRFELLGRVRAPFAHSRGDVVPESDVRLAEIYCRELLEVLGTSAS